MRKGKMIMWAPLVQLLGLHTFVGFCFSNVRIAVFMGQREQRE